MAIDWTKHLDDPMPVSGLYLCFDEKIKAKIIAERFMNGWHEYIGNIEGFNVTHYCKIDDPIEIKNPFENKKCNYVSNGDYCNPKFCNCSKSYNWKLNNLK